MRFERFRFLGGLTLFGVIAAATWLGFRAQVVSAFTAKDFDLVILNGRVIDPESKLDAIRHLGISNGKIAAVSAKPLTGRQTVDAKGLVVAPGFIDLHEHGQIPENYRAQAMDGVTSSFELEVGTADVDRWYSEREGKSLVNFGVSIGHIPVRMVVMGDKGDWLPSGEAISRVASETELADLKKRIEHGLNRGAVAVGFGPAYTPAATAWEIQEMFRVAAKYNASCHVHMREAREPAVGALSEVLAAALVSGAPLHIVHINSTGTNITQKLLQNIQDARQHGLDVTTECYPYTAGMTRLESALFDEGFQQRLGVDYKDLQWPETGERLTPETFARYRKQGGGIIVHSNTEEMVRLAVLSPLTMIASDGIQFVNGKGHPRAAGTYARILAQYVRKEKALSLSQAINKMSLMPAQRLEKRTPAMKNKGRIRVGADADVVVFDPERVTDRATYDQPTAYSEGFKLVLVNGVAVVNEGKLDERALPGKPVRAPIR
ncbi:MAG: amidohydrolase family protein [Acidobacteria bacterium]|nr:amidohydrolase family protein [Acidobacteriota bacterium]